MFHAETTSASDPRLLSWREGLAIGDDEIDADHMAIFAFSNRLLAEVLGDNPEYSVVGEVLVELIAHTGEHFLHEEALMQAIAFADAQEHMRQHRLLMDKVNTLHRRYMDGRANVAADVVDFIRSWLVPHIENADLALGRAMRAAS